MPPWWTAPRARVGPGKRELSAREDEDRDERDQREGRERRAESEMIDREAGEQRSDEARHRVTQSEQAEIAGPRRGSADFPRRVLGGELEGT